MAIELNVNVSVNRVDEIKRIPDALAQAFAKVSAEMAALTAKTNAGHATMIGGLTRLADQTLKAVTAQGTLNTAFLQTGQAEMTLVAGLQRLTPELAKESAAVRGSTAAADAAIHANMGVAQSFAAIAEAAARASKVVSQGQFSARPLGGAGAESVASLQAAAKAGVAYQQSLLSIEAAAQKFSQTQEATNKAAGQGAASFAQLSEAVLTVGVALKGGILFGEFISNVALTAARTETLDAVLRQVAKTAGLSSVATFEARDNIKALGITTQEASTIIARFIQNDIKLTDATKLAAVAQNAAAIAGQNSSEALSGLLHAILTLQPEVARTYGLTINLESSYRDFSAATGQTVESLSQHQKQQIALNQVLRAGESIAGVYGATMDTVGKKIGSLSRFIEESKNVIGGAYLPVLNTMVDTLTATLAIFQQLPTPVQIATAAILAAAAAVTALTVAVTAFSKVAAVLAVGSFITGFGELALVIGAVTAAVIGLTKVWRDLHAAQRAAVTDPAAGLAQAQQQADILRKQLEISRKSMEQRGTLDTPAGQSVIANLERQIGEVEQKIGAAQQKINQAASQVQTDLNAKAREGEIAALREASDAPAKIQAAINAIDQKLAVLRGQDVGLITAYLGRGPNDPQFQQILQATETKLLKDKQDLNDKLLNIDKQTSGGRRTVAQENSRADIEVLEASLKQQLDLTKQGFDERRQLSDQALGERLDREPSAWREIQQASEDARKTIAVEEARALEQITVDMTKRLIAAEQTRYAAAKAAAGTNATAQAQVEADHVKIVADAEARITAARTNTAQVEQGLSQKSLEQRTKDEEAKAKLVEQFAQQEIDSRLKVIDAQKGLVQAQVQGDVLSKQEGLAATTRLQQEEFDQSMQLLQRKAAAEEEALRAKLGAETEGSAQLLAIRAQLVSNQRALEIRQQTERQTLLNQETEGLRHFAERATDAASEVLDKFLDGQLTRWQDLFDSIWDYFRKTLSDMIAYAVVRPIILTVATNVLGAAGGIGGAGATAGGAGGVGGMGVGDLTTGAGLAKQLYDFFWSGNGSGGMFGSLSTGINSLNDSITSLLYGVEGLQTSVDSAALAFDVGVPVAQGTAGPAFSTLGVAGGLAAVGGGIYGALNAQNTPAQAAYAASAAAGAFSAAAASGLLAAAGATAASTGWTGYGLIAAAVLAVIGMVLDNVIKPKGPRLAVAVGTGLSIGMQGDQLSVGGNLGSTVLRSERAGGTAATDPIQAGLEEGVTNAVESMVGAINAVAVDAGILMGATQQALDQALSSALVVNSSNADKMEADIKAQLEFIPLQISGFFLKPLSDAFAQIAGVDTLDEQISRFGVSVVGMATIFTAMNQKITELNQVANTDVLRSFGKIHEQLNAFALQLEQDAAMIAEEITTQVTAMLDATVERLTDLPAQIQVAAVPGAFAQPVQAIGSLQTAVGAMEQAGLNAEGVQAQLTALIESTVAAAFDVIDAAIAEAAFDEVLAVILAIPPAVAQLDPELQKLQQVTQAFAAVVGPLSQDIEALRQSTIPLGTVLAEAMVHTNELAQAIAESGNELALLFPLYDQYHQAIMQELALKEQQIQAQSAIVESAQSLIDSIDQQLNGQGLTQAAVDDITAAYAQLAAEFSQLVQPELVYQTGAAVIDTLNEMAALMTELLTRAQQDLDAIHQVQSNITANLKELSAATAPIDQQIAAQVQHINDLNAQIAAGGDPSAIIPLYDQLQQATMDLLNLQAEQIQQQLDGTLAQIQAQQDAIEAQKDFVAAQQDAIQVQQKAAQTQQQLLQEQASQLEQNLSIQQQLLEQSQALGESLRAQVRGGQPPVQQAQSIRAAIAVAQGQLVDQTGQAAIETLSTIQSLFGELQQLGEQTNQLDLIAEALRGLADLIPLADAQAASAQQAITIDQAQLDATNAQLVTVEAQLATMDAQLEALNAQLDTLNAIQIDTAAADAAQAQADAALFAVQQAAMTSLQAMQPALDAMAIDAQAAIDYATETLIAIQDMAAAEQAIAEETLMALAGTTNVELALLTVESQALAELQIIDAEIEALYYQQEAVKKAMEAQTQAIQTQTQAVVEQAKTPQPTMVQPIPLPVQVVNGGGGGGGDDSGEQRGGWIGGYQWGGALRPMRPEHLPTMPGFAGGGMAHIMTEPGERVYHPSSWHERDALETVNAMIPRFTVGGSGDGDTVPLSVPKGTFILNRRASKAIGSGFQEGGTVTQTTNAPVTINVAISVNATVDNHLDIRDLANQLTRHVELQLRAKLGRRP